MRRSILISALLCLFVAQAAQAQFGLDKIKKSADKVDKETKKFEITEADEVAIGEQISTKICQKYGVVQDPAIHKYVGLVGGTLAKKSSRSNLTWHFVVLDTDGVNAFAAPGGYIHITKGALGMMKSEAELAGVLSHEIAHVTRKHAVKAIQGNKAFGVASDQTGAKNNALVQRGAEIGFDLVLHGFGRAQELESDEDGPVLAAMAGYVPSGLPTFLRALQLRNKDSQQKQGLFASHPEMDERLQKLDAAIAANKSAAVATLEPRYKTNVKYQPIPIGALAVVDDPSAASSQPAEKPEEKKEEKKSSRFSIGKITNAVTSNNNSKQSASVTGSGGAQGVDRELNAKGGSNSNKVPVTITDADLATFIKDGMLTV